jgi:DNA-binding transcriptional MerR regulator/methylmalonyl-CoA mutase cobalamin-binding subunit
MKVVSRRTGLSPHVLRIWEKRYQAVSPERTDSNRRLYTDEEIDKLDLLAKLTSMGHAIGRIAKLDLAELRRLHESEAAVVPVPPKSLSSGGGSASSETGEYVERALQATHQLDMRSLEGVFDEASVALGYSGLLERVLVPVLHRIGDEWHRGNLTTAQEHAASAFIKDYLARTVRSFSHHAGAPGLLVATPPGQLHELGAIIVANLARKSGWNVTYLGASLPAEDIAGAAIRTGARAVALSIVYPHDDPALPSDLIRLRKLLPAEIPILVGGRAAVGYAAPLREIGALLNDTLPETIETLERLRKSR